MTKNLVADMVTGSLLSSPHHIYTLQLTADRSGNPGADLAEIPEGGGQVQTGVSGKTISQFVESKVIWKSLFNIAKVDSIVHLYTLIRYSLIDIGKSHNSKIYNLIYIYLIKKEKSQVRSGISIRHSVEYTESQAGRSVDRLEQRYLQMETIPNVGLGKIFEGHNVISILISSTQLDISARTRYKLGPDQCDLTVTKSLPGKSVWSPVSQHSSDNRNGYRVQMEEIG